MYACLRAIFERALEFGGGLFALAASVMADLTHHDPLCFPGLDAAGLPEAFIKAIKVCAASSTLLSLADTIFCYPSLQASLHDDRSRKQ